MQVSQETEFPYSMYISSQEEEGRKELAARPVKKEALIRAMGEIGMAGEWRITQTSCGLIVSFMRDEDLLNFQEVDVGNVLGVEATGYSFSSLDTYRQKVLIKDLPLLISSREVESALNRQGVFPLSTVRTRQGNIMVELGDASYLMALLRDGFDFYGTAKFACIPVPTLPPPPTTIAPQWDMVLPAPPPPRDSVVQCFKCQGFWHFAAQCPGPQRCVRCGDGHPVSECSRPRNDPICVHCSGNHHAAYKLCPVRLQMKTYVPLPQVYFPAYLPHPGYPQ
ncbi:uncharacterized protein LOC128983256 [Macrosteles quadrilineatus]|uniref:uncharacterized protein LOC128983256 n=1 Tax=Macrosteles quadrilineatus TaxID=74068 RepID=UPI0023E16FB0|nr:uncharacterized protein LOC128983256 [Macrosteles quadrilineatus]